MAVTRPRASLRTPDATMQVKDATREDILQQVNTYVEDSPTLTKAKDYVKSDQVTSRGIMESITDAIVPTGAGLSIDKGTLRERLSQSLGVGNLMTGLSESFVGELATAMGVENGEGVVKAFVSGSTQASDIIAGLDPKSANSFANAIATITGENGMLSFLDIGAELGTINYLTTKLISLGAIDAIDALLNKIRDERDLKAMLEDLAMDAAHQCELDMCKHFVEMMGSERAFAMRNPLITAIVSSYQFEYEDIRPYSERLTQLVNLIGMIHPQWLVYEPAPAFQSIEYFSKSTPDAITLFTTDANLRGLAAAGSVLAIEDPQTINQLMFPQVNTW